MNNVLHDNINNDLIFNWSVPWRNIVNKGQNTLSAHDR